MIAAEAQVQQLCSELRSLKQCVVDYVDRNDRQGLLTAPPNVGLKSSRVEPTTVNALVAVAKSSDKDALVPTVPAVGADSATDDVMQLLRRRSVTPRPPSILQAAMTKVPTTRPLQVSVVRESADGFSEEVGRLMALNASIRKQQASSGSGFSCLVFKMSSPNFDVAEFSPLEPPLPCTSKKVSQPTGAASAVEHTFSVRYDTHDHDGIFVIAPPQ